MTDETADLTFEEAYAELQLAIEELRSDTLTLERSLELYERGTALARQCTALLTTAELRIAQSIPSGAERVLREALTEEQW